MRDNRLGGSSANVCSFSCWPVCVKAKIYFDTRPRRLGEHGKVRKHSFCTFSSARQLSEDSESNRENSHALKTTAFLVLAPAVEFRIISSGGNTSIFALRDFALSPRRAINSSAADRPIASAGSAITVSGGSRYRTHRASSKLIIERCSGILILRSRNAPIAPPAISLFAMKMAVGKFRSEISFFAATYPDSSRKSPYSIYSEGNGIEHLRRAFFSPERRARPLDRCWGPAIVAIWR
jgi:hypothetical protein